MKNIISKSYINYCNSQDKFEFFHNNVINMPRASFSEIEKVLKLLKSLSSYILLIDRKIFDEPVNYKMVYSEIFNNYKLGVVPEKNRNIEFEEKYLNRKESADFLYSDKGKVGRMFRHYMGYFAFFGMIKDGTNSRNKIFDIELFEEVVLSPDNVLFDVFRNKMLNINIKDNNFIKNLKGINVIEGADYRPARAIINYCNKMQRFVTAFEISILLGRVDNVQDENNILQRAIDIGKILPSSFVEQKKYFFDCMGWKNNDIQYEYSQSQNPDFKFNVFLLFMKTFGLINYDETTNLISLTDYSKELVKEDIAIELLDLSKLLSLVDDDTEDSNNLADIIIRKRTDIITKAIQNDGELVEKLNKRNLRNPIIKKGKRIRSKLIAEVAKIKVNYLDELTKQLTFEGKSGRNYVEAHHIIEFNGENGPDITDNLICLGPQNHSLIHHGSSNTVDDFYKTCQSRGVISFERFKKICVKYRCLTKDHVQCLLAKKIISNVDAKELNALIDLHGVDPMFLSSLNVPTSNS